MMLATARRRAARRSAFTLLEILVVVAIVVILAGVGVVATTSYLENAKKQKAQLGARALSSACEAFYLNSGGTAPNQLSDLLSPPTGGALLKNGDKDLYDPWGKPYTMQPYPLPNGETIYYVTTVTSDNITISQYGIGDPACRPPQQ